MELLHLLPVIIVLAIVLMIFLPGVKPFNMVKK